MAEVASADENDSSLNSNSDEHGRIQVIMCNWNGVDVCTPYCRAIGRSRAYCSAERVCICRR